MPNAGDKKSVQTYPVCILYQNQDNILIGTIKWESNEEGKAKNIGATRVINLKNSEIKGLQLKGGMVNETRCPITKFYQI